MKKLLVLLFLVFAMASMKGQIDLILADTSQTTLLTRSPELIFYEGFEATPDSLLPTGWTQTVPGAWISASTVIAGVPPSAPVTPASGKRHMALSRLKAQQNAWAFTSAFNLTAGLTYTITFWIWMPGMDGERNAVKVAIGQTPTDVGMNTTGEVLYNSGSIMISPYTQFVKNYTPATSGVYYLGFNDCSVQDGVFITVDEIKIEAPKRQNDLAIKKFIYPFRQVPTRQLPVSKLVTSVENVGTAAQTNVQVSTTLNGTPTGTSAVVPVIEPGATTSINIATSGGNILTGANTLKATLTQTQTDDDPSDNVFNTTFIGTENQFRIDNTTNECSMPAFSIPVRFGSVFPITKTTYLSQVQVFFNLGVSQNFNIIIYRLNAAADSIVLPEIFTQQASRPNSAGWINVNIPNKELVPGNYFIGVQELVSNTPCNLAFDYNTEGYMSYMVAPSSQYGRRLVPVKELVSWIPTSGSAAFVRLVDIVGNEMNISGGFQYSQIPVSQSLTSVHAIVRNTGVLPQTNVAFSAALNGATLDSSTPVSVAASATQTLTLSTPPTTVTQGENTIIYTLTSDQVGDYTGKTIDTTKFTGTLNVYATDDPAQTNYNPVNPGNNTCAGNIYTITEEVALSQILLRFFTITSASIPIEIFKMNGNEVLPTPLFSQNVNRTSSLITINVSPSLILTPGNYYVCARHTGNLGIAADGRADKRYYTKPSTGNNVTAVTTTTNTGAVFLRMVFDVDYCPKPTDLMVDCSRPVSDPYVKFSWEGQNASYRVIITKEDGALLYDEYTGSNTFLNQTATYLNNLKGDSTYNWMVIGYCDAVRQDTAFGVPFTLAPDTVDFTLTANNWPDSGANLGVYTPILVSVQNNSTSGLAYQNVPVHLFLNNNLICVDTVKSNITPGDTQMLTFQNCTLDLSQPGIYTIQAIIMDDRDQKPENNTMTKVVFCSFVDVGVTAFVTPTETSVDLRADETVIVSVRNFGNNIVQNVPVTLIVNGTTYHEMIDSNIEVGEEFQYMFTQRANLFAEGVHQLVAFTSLTGDQNLVNDTVKLTVTNTQCTQPLPWIDDFTETFGQIPHCWESIKYSGNQQWQVGMIADIVPLSGDQYAYILYDEVKHDAWLYSPSVRLEVGKTYQISFYLHSSGNATQREELTVKIGTARTSEGMTYTLYENFTQSLPEWTKIVVEFTPTVTDRYYLGFWATSLHAGNMAIDQIKVKEKDNSINNDAINSDIILYPNPVNNVLFIQTEQTIQQIMVLDLIGKEVIHLQGNRRTIDLQSVSSGIYIIKIRTEKSVIPIKIVKQ